ncbi:MAG: twin-arginine translocase subunit TatC [Actinomycetota bacterium]|nr:twin-arginine translocase subunit TatC [Actinomycetota bacterium]
MPLVEHLRELRRRLGLGLLGITVGVVVAFVFWEPVLGFLRQPYCDVVGDDRCQLYAFGPLDQFAIRIKVSSIAGIVLSAPFWLYQIGAFITPALHRHEKRWAASFLVVSGVLFGVGVTCAYLTLSKGLAFLLGVGGSSVETLTSLKSYLNFVSLTLLAFGIAFLFPVVVLFLHLVGVLPAARMRAWRRGMLVAIAVATAVITPSTDPYSFLAMGVPLYLLYEVCIVAARLHERAVRRRPPAVADDPDTPSRIDPRPSTL